MTSSRHSRLDDLLIERGFFPDRAAVERAVIAGDVRVDGARPAGPAVKVAADAAIDVAGRLRFVSRGGVKLAGALEAFGLAVSGLACIDVGASTGGFTDCLLQAGAKSVVCVDVGYGQLAWKLRQDPRVRVFERTNIRLIEPESLGAPFDLIVCDLSFIGLARLAPTFAGLCHGADRENGDGAALRPTRFLGLVKPQFEAAHDETDHGVVRDRRIHERVVAEVSAALAAVGFSVEGACASPITGPAGNREFFVNAIFAGTTEQGEVNETAGHRRRRSSGEV